MLAEVRIKAGRFRGNWYFCKKFWKIEMAGRGLIFLRKVGCFVAYFVTNWQPIADHQRQ